MFVVARATSKAALPTFHSISDSRDAAKRVCHAKSQPSVTWIVLRASLTNGRILVISSSNPTDSDVDRQRRLHYVLEDIGTVRPTLRALRGKCQGPILHQSTDLKRAFMPVQYPRYASQIRFSVINRTTTSDVFSTVTTARLLGHNFRVQKSNLSSSVTDAPLTIAKYTSPLYSTPSPNKTFIQTQMKPLGVTVHG